ncbi:unnamed protein product (macronuclear) [Paramecium tetraurelia]|uniref:Uncharacterized protein n=1 Tax=Paramecium tetraurelia TaxID=5888 RepID=A0DN14_PARTE|nr:uncharacterized protein GSPATT00018636001 [Paramecium tetraurelia]CAK84431.1 unnamed protein product [Paramecium tetraurelia]|eukprot:XP_001451828.1 hypothetical protein (macronuclear) [Paramecium tetraurelia strain d4-2]
MNLEQIQKELDSIDRQTSIINLQCKLYCAYQSFMFRFLNKDNFKVYTFRNHYGSYMAFGMAIHNTYHLRQSILKQCIHLTKSKNPTIIKLAAIPITTVYFGVLFGLWHIPSFSGELAIRLYFGTQSAVFDLLMDKEEIFQDIPLRSIIK